MRKKDDDKQRSIKKAVIKLILEEGFHGTSISKIAKEAGVSPATVYIYYENKEIMLRDIYLEYSEKIFDYILGKINNRMTGNQIIEIIIKEYYVYIKEHNEIFHFVDQFANCPALSNQCSLKRGRDNINEFLNEMKEKKVFKNFENDNLKAILFYPIKSIAINSCIQEKEKFKLLSELIEIVSEAIIEK